MSHPGLEIRRLLPKHIQGKLRRRVTLSVKHTAGFCLIIIKMYTTDVIDAW